VSHDDRCRRVSNVQAAAGTDSAARLAFGCESRA
jgi:hypothetical protein